MKKRNIRSNWKGTLKRDPHAVLVAVCACFLILAAGLLLPHIVKSDNANADPIISFSEIMISNTAAYPTSEGKYYPWVELVNSTDEAVDCSGLHLSTQMDTRGAAKLSASTLAPGERVLIYLTNDTVPGALTCPVSGKRIASLYLTDSKGNIIQSLDVPTMKKNHSCIYDPETAAWTETSMYTPGEENTEAGYQRVQESLTAPETVYISEAVASNRKSLVTVSGEAPDWIELYNPGDTPADLSGWSLTDNLCNRRAYVFPEGTSIPAHDYLIACATDSELTDYIHTGFRLNADDGAVYLLNPLGQCTSSVKWQNLEHDESVARTDSGSYTVSDGASPGASVVTQSVSENSYGVYINEVICASSQTPDWIELYNATGSHIDLGGWYLSKKKSDPLMWSFPAGTGIDAGGYLLVVLTKDGTLPESTPGNCIAASFTLSVNDTLNGGENVLLTAPTGEEVDRIQLKDQKKDVSYGRADGYTSYRYFAETTPGSANSNTSYGACAGKVQFSVEGGLRASGPVTVELTTEGSSNIYYTTDGSAPTQNSTPYSGALTISDNTILRAVAAGNDMVPSEVATHTYLFGRTTTLRTVFVTGDSSSLIGSDGVMNTGSKTTQAVDLEIYDYDGSLMVSQSCALQLSGSNSRRKYAQKAFKLKALSAYGDSKFRAALFTNRDYTEYDSIVMRASGQDVFESHMKDSILTGLAAGTSVMYQETELAAVYINGSYWGMYNMRENLNEDSICQFEGWEGDNDDLDIICGSSMSVVQGSKDSYTALLKFVKNNDMSDDANYETVSQQLDIDNYIDYVCLLSYVAHEDLGNVMAYRNPKADGKWRWAIYDQDFSYLQDKNSVKMWLSDSGSIGSITTTDNTLFYNLCKNASFRDRFLTRMGELLATTFSSANVQSAIMTRYNAIADEMAYSCDRWDVKYSTFENHVKKFYDYAGTRTAKMILYTQSAFKLSDEDVQKYFSQACANESAVLATLS